MAIQVPSSVPTETQLEAELRAAIKRVFPLLRGEDIRHQTTFTFRFGHAEIVSGRNQDSARSRSDILIFYQDRPLAILELKRPGIGITDEDDAQGLSYARVLQPQPPLVVVTDGIKTRILETYTGSVWQTKDISEDKLAALFSSAARSAQSDIKNAVSILMGTDATIWMQAIRGSTDFSLKEKTGSWNEPLSPFIEDFMIPRDATADIVNALEARKRVVLLDGAPLSGKSNVLRELVMATQNSDVMAALYIDADPGVDLFEHLSLLLSSSLDWPLSREEARNWLTTLSRVGAPTLLLLIDNMQLDRDDLRRDVELLTSNQFGMGVRVVVAVDDSIATNLLKSRNGRSASALAKRAERVSLESLSEQEFGGAVRKLRDIHIGIVQGGQHSAELRNPWVLRAMCSGIVTHPNYTSKEFGALLSPVPGMELINSAREVFDVNEHPFSHYRELAQAVVEDAKDSGRSDVLKLESLETFLVRRAVAHKHLKEAEIESLLSEGLIREGKSQLGESIFVIRIPELLASEAAKVFAPELSKLCKVDPAAAASWLAGAASNLPLGDLISAQALMDVAIKDYGVSVQLIASLLETPPTREVLPVGTQATVHLEGVGVVNMTVQEQGEVLVRRGAFAKIITPESEDSFEYVTYRDVHPWLILSHIAGHPSAAVLEEDPSDPRVDPALLLAVGACPIILRRPGGDTEINSLPVHDLPDQTSIVCHVAGVAEPITWSMFRYFAREPIEASILLINQAIANGGAALLARIDIALRTLGGSGNIEKADWANETRTDLVVPAMRLGIGRAFVHD